MFQKQGKSSSGCNLEEDPGISSYSRDLEYLKQSLATSKTSNGISNSSVSVVNPVCLDSTLSQITNLQRRKQQLEAELQEITSILQQCEQYDRNLYQIIACEDVIQTIKDISSQIINLMEKIRLKKCQNIEFEKLKDNMGQIYKKIEKHREKVDKHNKKLIMHLGQTKSMSTIVNYCQKHNIRQVAFQYINQYLSQVVEQFRKTKRKGKFHFNEGYKQFSNFLKQYKSENIEKKIEQLWHVFDEQIWIQIMEFQKFFQGDISTSSFIVELQQAKRQIINKKIDIQILQNQIEAVYKKIGLNLRFSSKENITFEDIVHQIICEIVCPQLSTFKINGHSFTNENYLQLLQKSFTMYFQKINESYQCQNEIFSQHHCTGDLWQLAKKNLKQAILNDVYNIQKSRELQKNIKWLQGQLKSVQKEIVLQKQKSQVQATKQEQSQSRSPQIISVFSSAQARSFVSFSHTKVSKCFEIKNRVSIHSISFKVLKTLHISVNINRNIRASYVDNAATLTNRSHQGKILNKNSPLIQSQDSSLCQVRNLQFCKNKLILRKQSILTHEEIQIKRIRAIKVMKFNLIHIYFTKGFMSLQFLKDERSPNQKQLKCIAKYWLKCFKAIYYQHLDQIQIVDLQVPMKRQSQGYSQFEDEQKEQDLIKSSKIIEESHQSDQCPNKQNMQKNCDWFLQKQPPLTDRPRQQTYKLRQQQKKKQNYY